MARKGKCHLCGCELGKGQDIHTVTRGKAVWKLCDSCYDKEQEKNGESQAELNNYEKKLQDFLYNLCQEQDGFLPFYNLQIDEVKKRYDITSKDIYMTLYYINHLVPNPFRNFAPEFGVKKLIEFYYPLARKYQQEIRSTREHNTITRIDDCLRESSEAIFVNNEDLEVLEQFEREKIEDKMYGASISFSDIMKGEY